MDIMVDIDGTLTNERSGFNYVQRTPRLDIIDLINKLYESHRITLWTSRHSEDEQVTRVWLAEHNVKFHVLIFNKPWYDIFLDDKAINACEGKYIEQVESTIRRDRGGFVE